MLMFQYSKLLCMSDETGKRYRFGLGLCFYPEFGVLVRSSEKGSGRTLALQVRSSEKEYGRTLVRSLDSELGEGTGPNPGSAGLEFGEPAEFGTCQYRVIPGPFSELRTTQQG